MKLIRFKSRRIKNLLIYRSVQLDLRLQIYSTFRLNILQLDLLSFLFASGFVKRPIRTNGLNEHLLKRLNENVAKTANIDLTQE